MKSCLHLLTLALLSEIITDTQEARSITFWNASPTNVPGSTHERGRLWVWSKGHQLLEWSQLKDWWRWFDSSCDTFRTHFQISASPLDTIIRNTVKPRGVRFGVRQFCLLQHVCNWWSSALCWPIHPCQTVLQESADEGIDKMFTLPGCVSPFRARQVSSPGSTQSWVCMTWSPSAHGDCSTPSSLMNSGSLRNRSSMAMRISTDILHFYGNCSGRTHKRRTTAHGCTACLFSFPEIERRNNSANKQIYWKIIDHFGLVILATKDIHKFVIVSKSLQTIVNWLWNKISNTTFLGRNIYCCKLCFYWKCWKSFQGQNLFHNLDHQEYDELKIICPSLFVQSFFFQWSTPPPPKKIVHWALRKPTLPQEHFSEGIPTQWNSKHTVLKTNTTQHNWWWW